MTTATATDTRNMKPCNPAVTPFGDQPIGNTDLSDTWAEVQQPVHITPNDRAGRMSTCVSRDPYNRRLSGTGS